MKNLVKKLFFLRKITRALKLNSFIFSIIYKKNHYEELFNVRFSEKINEGYCVYDIGANMGYYSILYSKIVGQGGIIYSFEPSLINFNKLQENVKEYANIQTYNMGIGNMNSRLFLSQGTDDFGATSKILIEETESGNWVTIKTIDSFVETNKYPNAIKIDVEGYEFEVVEGALATLMNSDLKVVGIEIHTEILESRKLKDPIKKIENHLSNAGFEIEWTDFSHIVAYRK